MLTAAEMAEVVHAANRAYFEIDAGRPMAETQQNSSRRFYAAACAAAVEMEAKGVTDRLNPEAFAAELHDWLRGDWQQAHPGEDGPPPFGELSGGHLKDVMFNATMIYGLLYLRLWNRRLHAAGKAEAAGPKEGGAA